jgi:hypothetical protein
MTVPAERHELEAAREEVLQGLGAHFASDALSVDELDKRLALAFRATTRAELGELLADLPMLPEYARGTAAVSRVQVRTSSDGPARGFVGAFMGGTARRGPWLVPRHVKAIAIMGGVELDLSAARFHPGVTEIEAFALMGGIDVIVPHGVRVEALGFAFMGGFDASAGDVDGDDPDQPIIRLSGLAAMGGVEARHKKPSVKALAKFEKRLAEVRKRIHADR